MFVLVVDMHGVVLPWLFDTLPEFNKALASLRERDDAKVLYATDNGGFFEPVTDSSELTEWVEELAELAEAEDG